ncbi:hypothetical protein FACS189459_5290 [Bacilli bacterium]|nr:hypothetical protein FACS189459_5290 [Bacilli bacterium]GHU51758.1 hypothetical protein FACS189496_0690 [Bacilli bacterium]
MGLRLLAGVDLSIKKYKDAYEYYKDKLLYTHINNNHLVCDNINLLDCTLVNIV